LIEEAAKELFHLVDMVGEAMRLAKTRRALPEALQVRAENRAERLIEGGRIGRIVDDHPFLPAGHEFSRTIEAGGNHGDTRSERFENNQRAGIVPRGMKKHIARAKERFHFVAAAEKVDPVTDAERCRKALVPNSLLPSGHEEVEITVIAREKPHTAQRFAQALEKEVVAAEEPHLRAAVDTDGIENPVAVRDTKGRVETSPVHTVCDDRDLRSSSRPAPDRPLGHHRERSHADRRAPAQQNAIDPEKEKILWAEQFAAVEQASRDSRPRQGTDSSPERVGVQSAVGLEEIAIESVPESHNQIERPLSSKTRRSPSQVKLSQKPRPHGHIEEKVLADPVLFDIGSRNAHVVPPGIERRGKVVEIGLGPSLRRPETVDTEEDLHLSAPFDVLS